MTMKLSPYQSPFFLFIIFFISTLQTTISTSLSLSTISISDNSNTSFICALVPSDVDTTQSFLNCTSYPSGSQLPFTYPNISVSALTAGTNFQCFLRSQNTNTTTLNCWRFSGNLTYKRIYKGLMLNEFDAGDTHICGRVSRTGRLDCWQWPEFNSSKVQSISGIAVGGDFVCGLNEFRNIECFGNDTNITSNSNFSSIAAGSTHACGITIDHKMECWREIFGPTPQGVFTSLALGDKRSCALYNDSKAVCWGESNFTLPRALEELQFLKLEAQGRIFCGLALQNYSLFCWGNDNGDTSSMVFDQVMPGPCEAVEDCSCGPLPGSGMFCTQGVICQQCENIGANSNQSLIPTPSPSPSSPSSSNKDGNNKKRTVMLVVGCVGSVSLAMVVGFFVFKYCKTRVCRIHDSGRLDKENSRQNSKTLVRARYSLNKARLASMGHCHFEEFDLQVLNQVTENFSEEHKIGYGSFGSVYRATLADGREVAIKRAEPSVSTIYLGETKRQDKENAFLSELAQLSRVNHKNLVQLFGFCEDGNEQILVYEFMPNGSLHDHLHKLDASPLMSWTARLRVALDAARGIEYLHTYVVPPIIHRDIKSSNILLDTSWMAKVSDFGLSLMGPENDEAHLSLRAAGTIGYVDPEYYRLQQLTTKSDVYSFGVVLLEMLSGYKAIHHHEEIDGPRNVVDFALPYIVNDEVHRMLDPKLPPPTPFEIEAVVDIGYIAVDCVTLGGRDRPSMTEIVNSLEKALATCEAPPIFPPS